MTKKAHPVAEVTGLLTILTFWLSTVAVELFGSASAVAVVKEMIPWGFLLLVPALAITAASGFRMAGTSTDPRVVSTSIMRGKFLARFERVGCTAEAPDEARCLRLRWR